MKESVALAKDADAKKDFSFTRSDNSIHRVRNEPEKQLGSLRSVIGNIRHDGGTPSLDSIATELSSMHTAQRASVLLALQRTHGNRYVQRVVTGIQAKLKVGQPGDVYEQEADRVADEVMRMPEPRLQRQAEEEEEEKEKIQAKPVAEQITYLVQRQVEEEEEEKKEEEEIIQTKESPGQTPEVTSDFESSINTLDGGSQPLPKSVRNFFEPRFSYDFSQVRVHSNPEAAQMARALNAKAFTTGRDVVFGAGQYAPFTNSGRRLLAHELVHVVQQSHKYCRESNKHVVNSSSLATSMIQRQLIEGLEQRISPNLIIEWSDDFSGLLDRVVTALSEEPAFAELAKAHLWQPFSEALHRYLESCGAHCAALEEGKKMRFNAVAWYDRDADLITYAILRTTTVGLGGPLVKVPEEKLPKQVYELVLCGDKYENLTIEQVEFVVRDLAKHLRNWSEIKRNSHKYFKKLHDESPFVASVANFVGGVSLPPIEMWSSPSGPLSILEVAESLLDAGEPLLAADLVVAAEMGYQSCHERFYTYRFGTIKGAEISLTGLKVTVVVGSIAATVATGGMAKAAELGLLAKAGAIALGGGGYAAFKETGTQLAEKHLGLRKEFDWNAIWRGSTDEAAAYFFGGLVGGALANKLYKWLKPTYFNIKEFNKLLRAVKRLGGAGLPEEINETMFISFWERYGIEFLATMGSTAVKEPLVIVLDDLKATGEFPTDEELIKKLGWQLWTSRTVIKAFITFLAVKMPLGR